MDGSITYHPEASAIDQKCIAKGKQPVEEDDTLDTCVICLSSITERAVAVPCNHLAFDFLCLVSWLQEQSSCPLCKATLTSVQYDWRSPDDFKTYHVPSTQKAASLPPTPGPNIHGRRARALSERARSRRRFAPYQAWGDAVSGPARADQALTRRRLVYERKAHSLHVGANRISEYRDFTPATFVSSPTLQNRARIFMRRELQVFAFLQTQSRLEFLLEYVVGMLKKLEIKGANGAMEELVAEFLGRENAGVFLRELEAWLRSPYLKLEDWDRHVQYADEALNSSKGGIAVGIARGTGA